RTDVKRHRHHALASPPRYKRPTACQRAHVGAARIARAGLHGSGFGSIRPLSRGPGTLVPEQPKTQRTSGMGRSVNFHKSPVRSSYAPPTVSTQSRSLIPSGATKANRTPFSFTISFALLRGESDLRPGHRSFEFLSLRFANLLLRLHTRSLRE